MHTKTLLLVSESDFFMDNPHMLQDGHFKRLESAEAKFVVYYCDHSSPIRKMFTDEKIREAVKMSALGANATECNMIADEFIEDIPPLIKEAMYKYDKLQGNTVLRKSIEAVDAQIKNINDNMREQIAIEDSNHIKNLADALNKYIDLRQSLLDKVEMYHQDRLLRMRLDDENKKSQQQEESREGLSTLEELLDE